MKKKFYKTLKNIIINFASRMKKKKWNKNYRLKCKFHPLNLTKIHFENY